MSLSECTNDPSSAYVFCTLWIHCENGPPTAYHIDCVLGAGSKSTILKGTALGVREAEWPRRLAPVVGTGKGLFICGANHISTFNKLLMSNGASAAVVNRDLQLPNTPTA